MIFKRLMVILISLFITKAYAEESFTWLFYTKDVLDNKVGSIGLDSTRILLERFNSVDSEIQIRDLNQINQLMLNKSLNEKSTYCAPGRVKTKIREKNSLFSQPLQLYPHLKLYFTNDSFPLPRSILDINGQLISLNALFKAQPKKLLAVAKGRSYGPSLDKQISALPKKNIQVITFTEQDKTLSDLLQKNRINFSLIYPTKFEEHFFADSKYKTTVHSINIQGESPYTLSRIACTKTPLGEKIINNINSILNNMYKEKSFYGIHKKYLNKSDIADFNKHFNHVFIERNF